MRNQIIALALLASSTAYAVPTQYTAMQVDVEKAPIVLESQVIEEALRHFELMDKTHTNALTAEAMRPHMSAIEMYMADPEHDRTISRGKYIVETEKRFRAVDTTHSGKITHAEWNTAAGQNLLRMLRMPVN